MAYFESGVNSYIHAQAKVEVFFPVDAKGCADISCRQCYYFRDHSNRCGLNGEVCAYPSKCVGDSCPLHPVEEENE